MNLLPLFEKTPKMILVISGLVALGVGDHLSTTGLALSIEQCHTNLHLKGLLANQWLLRNERWVERVGLQRSMRKGLGVMDKVPVLIVVMGFWLHTSVKLTTLYILNMCYLLYVNCTHMPSWVVKEG